MKKLCSLLVVLCCLVVQPLCADAATWVKLYELGYEGSVSVDADSFTYDRAKGKAARVPVDGVPCYYE